MKARIALFFLLILALPLSGFSQSTLNFPRLYATGSAAGSLGLTGIAVVNPASTAASTTYTLYGAAGNTVATTTVSIPARSQYTKLGSELFPSANAAGWVQATSSTTGLTGFWLAGDFAVKMDGAAAAPTAQEMVFPVPTTNTELSVASVSTVTNTITIRIYDASGTEMATAVTANLSSKQIYQNPLVTIFPSVNLTNAIYVKVSGTGAFTGTTLAIDLMYAPSWSVINGISTASTTIEAYFAHALSGPETGGPKWQSVLGVANLSAAANTLTISYTTTAGVTTSVTRSLAGRGALRETMKDMFGFTSASVDGWVRVSGTAPIGAFLVFGYDATKGVAVVPMQFVGQTQLLFSHVAQSASWWTGLAILNPTSVDAQVDIYVMRGAGTLVGGAENVATANLNIAAGTFTTKLLDEYVPAANADDGFVYVKSKNNVPLYAYQLFFSRDLQEISNVAAGEIDPSITFTPPTPASAGLTPLTPLTITTFNASSLARSASLTITGTGFNATAASNSVVFTTATGTSSVTPTTASATSIAVTVPTGAISGPVYVSTGGRATNSRVLEVLATATTLPTPATITVTASRNTVADVYVTTAAGTTPLNITGIDITLTSAGSTTGIGAGAREVTAGTIRRLWISGDAISAANGTTVSISGTGITQSAPVGGVQAGAVIIDITVAGGAATGPRNIILTNTNLDTSVYAGGLIIR